MKNRKYFPYERNSYYFGKLLTARDFEAEQRYLNDKRRLHNRLIQGNGVLAGLGVVMVDDSSVVVQAGCAVDAAGREIVVPETRVVKLSTIDGYAALASDSADLAISYDEQPADEVYAAMGNTGEEAHHNKTQETYRLELVDTAAATAVAPPLDEFVQCKVVYADKQVEVRQYVPRYVQHGTDLLVRVEIVQVGHGVAEYAFSYLLETPGFTGPDGEGKLKVGASGLSLGRNQSRSFEYRFAPKAHVWGGAETTFVASGFVIKKDGESFALNQQHEFTLQPLEGTVAQQFLNAWYAKPMDKQLADSYDEQLWLARIDLFRQKSSVLIDRVYPMPFGQYSYNAQQLMQLRGLEAYYPPAGMAAPAAAAGSSTVAAAPAQANEFAKNTACGVFDLGLGLGYSTRDVVYSDEIMHGLGTGPVYVEVGIEYITAEGKKNSTSEIFLGSVQLFGQEGARREQERIYNIETAVKILPERGTFVVAVLPKEPSGIISLRVRWYAVRMNEVTKQIKTAPGGGEKVIMVNPDTIIVQPRGTAHISPVFINMPTEPCRYRMVDAEGGSINNDGVYTAPAKEGVYEIRVEAISDPTIYANVFAIVTQKKRESDEDAGELPDIPALPKRKK